MFHYLGNDRLQLWFITPNVCASFLSMTILLSIGIFLCCVDRKKLYFKIIAFSLGFAVIAQELLMALTYSRGGYLALGAGLVFAWLFCRKKWVLFFFLAFIAILLLTSNGVDRVQSIGATGEGSIRNRLLLWNGGVGIIAKNWFSGVGSTEKAGELYTGWYQPLWLNETYHGLISDYLNITVSYGIFALFAYLSVIFLALWLGIRLWLAKKNSMLLLTLGAMTAYLLSAIFSTFYIFTDTYQVFIASFLIVIAFLARGFYTRQFKPKLIHWAVPFVGSSVICVGLLLYGFISNSRMPYAYHCKTYQDNSKSVQAWQANPRTAPKATIVYLFCSDTMTLEKEARLTIRPLLARNYAVIAAGVDSGLDGLAKAEMLLKRIAAENANAPLFLMGQGDGAKQAIVAASKTDAPKLSAVIALGAPASWPFDELSPEHHISGLKTKLLLIHDANSRDDAETLKKICDENKIPVTMQLIPDAGSYLDGKRNDVLDAVDAFISKLL